MCDRERVSRGEARRGEEGEAGKVVVGCGEVRSGEAGKEGYGLWIPWPVGRCIITTHAFILYPDPTLHCYGLLRATANGQRAMCALRRERKRTQGVERAWRSTRVVKAPKSQQSSKQAGAGAGRRDTSRARLLGTHATPAALPGSTLPQRYAALFQH